VVDAVEERMRKVAQDLSRRFAGAAGKVGGVEVFTTRVGSPLRREVGIAATVGAEDTYVPVRWRRPHGPWHELRTPEEAGDAVAVTVARLVGNRG
jgi:hypothetical protein